MPIKAMWSLFSARNRHPPPPPSPARQAFSAALMEDNIATADAIITKWSTDSSNSYASLNSLFYESRAEARELLRAVSALQRTMLFFVSDDTAAADPAARSRHLVRAQTLMQAAMRRLEREFHHILSTNHDCLDPDSVSARSSRSSLSAPDDDDEEEEEIRAARDSIGEVERASAVATADLRAIAETMISAGYGKECVRVYKTLRKSIVEEGLYRLGFQRLAASQVHKMDWEMLELKIKSWLGAARTAVQTLFVGERALIDHVFPVSDSVRESCFADITSEAAVHFFAFPELAAKSKKSPERIFRMLDLYDAVSDLWPEIESAFSFASTAAVRTQALASLLKLAEAARATLVEFEAAVQKDSSKAPVLGGGVHPLTRYVMNYIVFLTDYEATLADIYADFPLETQSPLPESFFDAAAMTPSSSAPPSPAAFEASPRSVVAVRLAWLVLVLLCKLDGKAEAYKNVALSYLFLANNLEYIVNKVRSSKLRFLLGDDWAARHGAKARHYTGNYARLAWAKVTAAVPAGEVAEEEALARMREFNAAFEEACRSQAEWVLADASMRGEVRTAAVRVIVPAYRQFYERYRAAAAGVVRFAPEDVRSRLMGLFGGSAGSGSGSSHASSLSTRKPLANK